MSYLRVHDEHVAREGGFSASVLYVTSALGGLEVEQCDQCPLWEVRCVHEHMRWNAEGTVLTCKLCGMDGT